VLSFCVQSLSHGFLIWTPLCVVHSFTHRINLISAVAVLVPIFRCVVLHVNELCEWEDDETQFSNYLMFHVLYVLQTTQKVRDQNMRFEIVTAVSFFCRGFVDMILFSIIKYVSTFRLNVIPLYSESHDFDPEDQGSSFIGMFV
jgi:hypothetical protein